MPTLQPEYFQAMDVVFWWTGALVWFAVLVGALFISVEFLRALVLTANWQRFCWKAARARGAPMFPGLLRLPLRFCIEWVMFFGFREGNMILRVENGEWRGFGNWVIHPSTTSNAWPAAQAHAAPTDVVG